MSNIDVEQKLSDNSNLTVMIGTQSGVATIDMKDIIEFTMIEDIFAGSIVGKLIFIDRTGGVELLPFVGHEPVTVVYGEDGEFQKDFVIFSIDAINTIGQLENYDMLQITVYLVEPLFLTLVQRKFSLSWKDKKISDIVDDICQNLLLFNKTYAQFENTNETLPYFYMPYWTPAESIKWLMRRASSAETQMPGYLFYSNAKGLNFVTLEKLLRQTNLEKDYKGNPLRYYLQSKAPNDPNKILGFSTNGIDYQSFIDLKGGIKHGFDFSTKSLKKVEHMYSETISKFTMLGKKTMFFNIDDTRTKFEAEGDSDEAILQNIAWHEFIQRYVQQYQVHMTVKGHERRYAGMVVDIIWPSTIPENLIHMSLEGKYLVKSVTNTFSSKSLPYWKQLLVLLKVAYTDSNYKSLVAATKVNLETRTTKIGRAR